VASGEDLSPGRIYDINGHTLAAALVADGCETIDLGLVPDDLEALLDAARRGVEEADLLLLSGGSSLGGGDLVVETFEKLGKLLLHGVAVKPGKPLVLATATDSEGRAKMMIGLPGYPMSALSDYLIFVRPYLRKAAGAAALSRWTDATLARKHFSVVGRYEFLPVGLEDNLAHPLTGGSSSISALARADGFVEVDENTEVLEEGSRVRVQLL
ncbi:MAG: molybdopterin-binding protein, partial [Actinomycetota bacterium]